MTANSADERTVPQPGTYAIDPAHTTITIVARHLMVSKVRGQFGSFSGTIAVEEDPTESSVEVEIDAASIDTRAPDRDTHLRSPDFLDVENHPKTTFKSTKVEPAGDGWKLTGDLTLRGVTKPIDLDFEYLGTAVDPWGNSKAIFEATGRIDREAYGLVWNAPLETGGVLVSKHFDIVIDAQAGLQA